MLIKHHSPARAAEHKTERLRLRNFFTGAAVFHDKDNLPVSYAAEHAQEKTVKPDEVSVLWHELLSPLTVIKGYITTLLELDYAITEDQKKQYLLGIESASNRVIRLLENLRDITRLEDKDSLITRPISMVDLLGQIATEVQSQTTRHVIKIIPPGRLPPVRADGEKIEQVVSNLLYNAVKYSPDGGDIELEARAVRDEHELKSLCPDAPRLALPCLVVSVSDCGIGIPAPELERIFERFYRVQNKMIRSTPGAGLGGNIWAANRPQGGSVLRFSLPLERTV